MKNGEKFLWVVLSTETVCNFYRVKEENMETMGNLPLALGWQRHTFNSFTQARDYAIQETRRRIIRLQRQVAQLRVLKKSNVTNL